MQGYAKEITDNKELNVTSVKNRFQFVGISEWTRNTGEQAQGEESLSNKFINSVGNLGVSQNVGDHGGMTKQGAYSPAVSSRRPLKAH
jgi:hypothetical protein